jgi:hypothetical protein
VNWQTVESEQYTKEAEVNDELEQVRQKIQVEDPATLFFPAWYVNLHFIHIVLIREIGR